MLNFDIFVDFGYARVAQSTIFPGRLTAGHQVLVLIIGVRIPAREPTKILSLSSVFLLVLQASQLLGLRRDKNAGAICRQQTAWRGGG